MSTISKMFRLNKQSYLFNLDKYNLRMYSFRLLLYVTALSVIGVLVINSAADGFAAKQAMGLVMGLVVAVGLSLVDYNFIAKHALLLYVFNILLLGAVRVFGTSINGARRWFSLGPFGTLQPSEFSKVLMILIFAWLINSRRDKMDRPFEVLKITLLYAIPTGLVLIEPDLSTTIVFLFIFCVLMFVGGLSYRIIGVLAIVFVPLGIFLLWYVQQPGQILLQDYQLERVLSFINPSEYLLSTYNQQYNSIMAIGSGLLTGKGLNNNTITSVKGGNFISEPQTDFIFAIVGEELGFIGGCIVLGLILLIIIECINIARNAHDMTGRLIAASVSSMLAFQSFINIGVATGIIPNTGIPLPFVSYGLSSLTSSFICIGLVLNVGLQRNRR